jgi:class 3 adenylate cyclase
MSWKVLSFFLLSSICFFSFSTLQTDRKTLEKELASLKGPSYVKRAIQIGEGEMKSSNIDDALYFFKKAQNYSLSKMSAQSAAFIAYDIAGKIAGNSENAKLNEFCLEMVENASEQINDQNILNNIYSYSNKILPYVSPKSKKRLNIVINRCQNAYRDNQERIKQQKEEESRKQKEALDSMKLSETVNKLQNLNTDLDQLQATTSELNIKMKQNEEIVMNMSRENLIKEALLQKNRNFIDSLNYEKMLDSIIIESNSFELDMAKADLDLQRSQKKLFLAIASLLLIVSSLIFFFLYKIKKHNKLLYEKNLQIESEKNRSEELLLNILPKEVAEELKATGKVKAQQFNDTTIIFTDFVNFSNISNNLTPQELVNDLDYCFGKFDSIIEKYNVEKIKTIGDAYMCISGVPTLMENHAELAIYAAIDFLEFMKAWNANRRNKNQIEFNIRIGVHSGPVCAGVVGTKKFIFDVWGDAVNIAARMESSAQPNSINISENTYKKVKSKFKFKHRGAMAIKNMGELDMYYYEG